MNDQEDDFDDVKNVPHEAPKSAPLGNYAFPENRLDGPFPRERDTEKEKALRRSLENHFKEEKRSFTSSQVAMMKGFLENGMYSHLFTPPTVPIIFRSMFVKGDWVKNVLGTTQFPLKKMITKNAKFTFTPLKHVSSWTGDIAFASEFNCNSYPTEENMFEVILHARVSENKGTLLMCEGALYDLDFASFFDHEDEVIAMGPVNVFKIQLSKKS